MSGTVTAVFVGLIIGLSWTLISVFYTLSKEKAQVRKLENNISRAQYDFSLPYAIKARLVELAEELDSLFALQIKVLNSAKDKRQHGEEISQVMTEEQVAIADRIAVLKGCLWEMVDLAVDTFGHQKPKTIIEMLDWRQDPFVTAILQGRKAIGLGMPRIVFTP